MVLQTEMDISQVYKIQVPTKHEKMLNVIGHKGMEIKRNPQGNVSFQLNDCLSKRPNTNTLDTEKGGAVSLLGLQSNNYFVMFAIVGSNIEFSQK